MVSQRFLCHCADYQFDFWYILACSGLIGRKGVNLSKVPHVITNSINNARCHSSLPDYCAKRDHLLLMICEGKRPFAFYFFLFLLSSCELSGELARQMQVFLHELVILMISPHNPRKIHVEFRHDCGNFLRGKIVIFMQDKRKFEPSWQLYWLYLLSKHSIFQSFHNIPCQVCTIKTKVVSVSMQQYGCLIMTAEFFSTVSGKLVLLIYSRTTHCWRKQKILSSYYRECWSV